MDLVPNSNTTLVKVKYINREGKFKDVEFKYNTC